MAFRLKPLAFFIAAALLAVTPGNVVHAAPAAADPGCDGEFMDAVESRGWMEGQRELSQAENLVYKSDSVLEYTCFQQLLEVVAVKAGPQFTESVLWSPVPGLTTLSVDIALEEVVGHELISYLQADFPHSFRGGRVIPVDTPPAQRNPGSYVCDAMKYVWEQSKCANYMEKEPRFKDNADLDTDGYYEFSHYAGHDPRKLPSQFLSCAPPTQNYFLAARAAYNVQTGAGFPESYQELPQENPNDAATYKDDPLRTHLQFMLPDANCGAGLDPPVLPIPTGVVVFQLGRLLNGEPQQYEEHVCSIPGCSFVPGAGNNDPGTCTRR